MTSYQDGATYWQRKANPEVEFRRYDVIAHLKWLMSEPTFTNLLSLLRNEGTAPRREGRPFREYAINVIERPVRFPVRRWHGMIRNRIERVLPPALRGAVDLLVRNPDVPLEIVPGRALSPERARTLQRDCRALLSEPPYERPARDQRALDARRKRLNDGLEAIDSPSPVQLALLYRDSLGLGVGSGVNVSATGFGTGSQVAVASAARCPGIGHAAAIEGDRILVEPLRVPRPFDLQPPRWSLGGGRPSWRV